MEPRLFAAIRPPRDIRDTLLAMMGGVERARWQDDAQLHLTLRFFGVVTHPIADHLVDGLAALRFDPFELSLRGCGAFAKRGKAHTLWIGIAPSEPLTRLQHEIERLAVRLGLAPDPRVYRPHVTLARLNAASGPVGAFCQAIPDRALGRWRCDAYTLYESHLRPEGSLYEPIRVYPAAE